MYKRQIVYSTYSFFRKLASAVSGSLSSFVLGFIGYNVAEDVYKRQVFEQFCDAIIVVTAPEREAVSLSLIHI